MKLVNFVNIMFYIILSSFVGTLIEMKEDLIIKFIN